MGDKIGDLEANSLNKVTSAIVSEDVIETDGPDAARYLQRHEAGDLAEMLGIGPYLSEVSNG